MAKNKNLQNNKSTEETKNTDDTKIVEDLTSTAKGTVFDGDYEGETGNTKAAQKAKKKNTADKQKMTKGKIIAIAVACAVLVGGLVGVYFAVSNMKGAEEESTSAVTYPTDENGEQYAVDAKGNKIEAEKDGNGNIITAGIEELIEEVPADIEQIDVTNSSGSFTVKSQTTVENTTTANGESATATSATKYTLVGFEGADLQAGQADAIANDAAAVTTTKVIDINGENPQDYGLDKPRATVKVKFNNNKQDTIYVGNDVTGDDGVYIKVNDDKAIYVVSSDSVDSFFYNPLSLISRSVTDAASTEDDSQVQKLTISGTNFPQTLVFVPNDDKTNTSAYYKMTEPKVRFANVGNGSAVIESILSLTAESVVSYHPTDEQKKEFGVDNPYAQIVAEYKNVTYTLLASKPDDNNSVNLYNKDKNIIYAIPAEKVPWVTTSYDQMVYEYVMRPDKNSLSSIEVTIPNDKIYAFEMTTSKSTDDSGNEISTVVAKYDGKELESSYFDTFFQNIESAQREGAYEGNYENSAALTIKFNYNTGKESDTITYYKGQDRKYLENYNGDNDSFVFDTYIDKILNDTKLISQNKQVDSL